MKKSAITTLLFSHLVAFSIVLLMGCKQEVGHQVDPPHKQRSTLSARDILGNSDYQAISYGGYRAISRDTQPTIEELKEDLRLLHALDIKLLRTYNVQKPHASNVLQAIRELKAQDASFEMYVMLGAWIDCKNAWTEQPPIHDQESEQNAAEIKRAVHLAQEYPDIVKIIAVGNEAMVKWAAAYYVEPQFILKWVNHLQALKGGGELPEDLWITSSDNFASWGGGDDVYKVPALEDLIRSVDFISLHTYPMHDTHYNPDFWGSRPTEAALSEEVRIQNAMNRSLRYAQRQYQAVVDYMHELGVDKPVHIGETGWASVSNGHYGPSGSQACDEYKQKLYYDQMRQWTTQDSITCFYFEAFDEQWKDAGNPQGSENHFGLFTIEGQAKYVLWDAVDQGTFRGLGRDGGPVTKTFGGDYEVMKATVQPPIMAKEPEPVEQ